MEISAYVYVLTRCCGSQMKEFFNEIYNDVLFLEEEAH